MKIKSYKTKRKDISEFKKEEWKKANKETYGKTIDWFEEKRELTAYDSDSNILGVLSLKITSGVAYVKTLIIKDSQRNKGIGEKLMAEAEEISRESGCHKIYLQTGKTWRAGDFYKKLSYKISGEQKDHYFHQDFVVFSKTL